MASSEPTRTWRKITAELALENDGNRFTRLSVELIRALDAEEAKPKTPVPDNCIPWPRKQSRR